MAFFENKLRFYHTTDLNADRSTWREVYPLGSKAFEWKKDKKEVFYRQDKKGDFVFSNITEDGKQVDDFEFFNAINNDIIERCATRYIVTERNCEGIWTIEHTGKFTMNDGKWDQDKCTVELKQSIVDEYSCLIENKKEEYNILETAPTVTTFSPVQNNYDFAACRNKDWLATLNKPCDGTGGWKKFYHKVAFNTPQPGAVILNNSGATNYSQCGLTKDHAFWVEINGLAYTLETYRFADSSQLTPITGLDSQSTIVVDQGMVGYTTNARKDFKVFRPDDNLQLTIVANHPNNIVWFDVDDTIKYAFFMDDTGLIRAYSFATGITRTVESTVVVSTSIDYITGLPVYNISYGDGVLLYHDSVSLDLIRYNPQTFLTRTIQTGMATTKHVYSEAGFLTWFDVTAQIMYGQEKDDTTFENIILRDNQGDCRFAARENEWLVFDDEAPTGAQIAMNLITRGLFSPWSINAGTPQVRFYGISNGWFLSAVTSITAATAACYLDSFIPGTGSAYSFTINPLPVVSLGPVFMAAGVERIYVSGYNAASNQKIWSIDQDTQVVTEIEDLGNNPLNCLLMNDYEQIISTNVNRVEIRKENIQREDELEIWFREKIVTVCSGSSPVSPGAGWFLYRNQCNQFGTSTWVRQPAAAAPPAIDVQIGGCLCEDLEPNLVIDLDECSSLDPNGAVVSLLMNPTTAFTAPQIRGFIEVKQSIGSPPFQKTWYIENPRDGSTYTWALPAMPGATIISGQGTSIMTANFTVAFPITQVECQEVNACSAGPIPLATLPFIVKPWNGFLSGLCTHNIPDVFTADIYSGGTGTVIGPNQGLTVTGASSTTSTILPDGRRQTDSVHNGIAASLVMSATPTPCPTIGGAMPVVLTPTPPNIISPLEVCPTGLQTYYIDTPRIGCQYQWSVDAPCFIVGPTVGTSVVVDMNNAVGTEVIRYKEICPIQPTNYQLVAPCNELHEDSWWWIIGPDVEYNRNRLLKNVIEGLVKSICPDITVIRSDLFQWNPLNPSLINYAYGGINEYNYLTIAQKSDIRTPLSSGAATIGNLTWEQFVEWMANMEVYYIIIGTELHIEHISKLKGNIGLDTTQAPYNEYADDNRQFTYAKAEMSRREEFEWEEALNAEFVGFPIEYKTQDGTFSLCVNQDTLSNTFKELTTDLKYIQTNPGAIGLKGFVILANTFDGQDYRVIQNPGVITGINILNSPMSISALQDRFMRNNRILPFGWLNRAYTIFESSQFFKKQESFKIPYCCDIQDFDPLDLIKTTLGEGEIESAEIDFESDTIELKLKYE